MIELSTMKRHDGCRHPGVRFRVKFLCNGAPQHVAQTGGQIVACVKAKRANPILRSGQQHQSIWFSMEMC